MKSDILMFLGNFLDSTSDNTLLQGDLNKIDLGSLQNSVGE
jgi:hypothetical protein